MIKSADSKKVSKFKQFCLRLFEKIDKKMMEQAKSSKCKCNSDKGEDKSCCN